MRSPLYGGIEAGGTKFVCAVGRGPNDIRRLTRIPTGRPSQTLPAVIAFFREAIEEDERVEGIGIASFGPLELRRGHPDWGRIGRTPKEGWEGTDLAGAVAEALDLPVEIDTDVNGAALAEWRWGAGGGVRSVVYITVGTGVGGGAVVDGRTLSGLVHPEMGHVAVGRVPGDDFPGLCPFHGDCLEGMASGPAIEARWGVPAEQLGELTGQAVEMEAAYLARGLRQIVYVLAPERAVLGGGVMSLPRLLARTHQLLLEEMAGYGIDARHEDQAFLVPPRLGGEAGVVGALALAELAVSPSRQISPRV